MVQPKEFTDFLSRQDVEFFAGVPDSLLKEWISYLSDTISHDRHITAANEGNALALAAGYHLATGKLAGVYLQNSGLGNAVNPLTSLADPEVYAIPMVLVIGWRGEPGVSDEPQHVKQGKITEELLKTLDVPHVVLDPALSLEETKKSVEPLIARAVSESRPCALLVRKGFFEEYALSHKTASLLPLTREQAIECVVEALGEDDVVVSTTGKISRELYEIRKRKGVSEQKDFLTVGSMGHASQIALGIALNKKDRQVYCLDGDGATIMHMGGLATVGWTAPKNFKHIVLNNLAHESVGGQPSAAEVIDLSLAAKANGYPSVAQAADKETLLNELTKMASTTGPCFLEVKVNLESRANLGRPKETPVENKKGFMDFLNRS